jgi:probable rRNA maturation factor
VTRELLIRNRQRTRAIDGSWLRRITKRVIEVELAQATYELGIHLVEPSEMARINETFLGHEGTTDVITFDHSSGNAGGSLHGELFISVADAVAQARAFGTTWPSEIIRYIIHGLLHLRGFDDLEPARRRLMKRQENRILRNVGAHFSFSRVAKRRRHG